MEYGFQFEDRTVHFKTKDLQQVRMVDLSRFNPGCRGPVMVLDLHANVSGDVTSKFHPFSKVKMVI